MQPSPIEFSADPVTETQRDEESEDDEIDDEDEDDMVAEEGQGSDAAATEKPLRGVADEELPPQNVSRFDGRQKRTGFIDVWWLFDDGGAGFIHLHKLTKVVYYYYSTLHVMS